MEKESTGFRDGLDLGGGKGKEEMMINVPSYVDGGIISSKREDKEDRFQRQNEAFYFRHTGMHHFIELGFTALCRYCIFTN